MKKMLLVISAALFSVILSGFVYGQGFVANKNCNKDNSGRFAAGYQASNSFGGLGFMNNVDPYAGAPVYVVNNSDVIYGAREVGGHGMRFFNGMGSFGRFGGNGLFGNIGNGNGLNGPFARGVAARQAKTNAMVNPYGHPNTPTRGPRDFFAPNPPSIGP